MRTDVLIVWPDLLSDLCEPTALFGKTDVVVACMLRSPLLIVEVGMAAATVPGFYALLQGGVIQFDTPCKRPVQLFSLCLGWIQTVLECLHAFFLLSSYRCSISQKRK